jgi:hypothetical protein
LETELGEPVVAVWVSPDEVERRYFVPGETSWPLLLQWLLAQGLPELVPGVMRRAMRHLATDQTLMTHRERDVRSALTKLEADYVAGRGELERQLEEAQGAASAVREGLLYGTGRQLVGAVQTVLGSAGITVVDLDEKLGDAKNADLLCTHGVRVETSLVPAVTAGDPDLVESLVTNLIDNAIKYNLTGGHIQLSTTTAAGSRASRSLTPDRWSRPAMSAGCSSRSGSLTASEPTTTPATDLGSR